MYSQFIFQYHFLIPEEYVEWSYKLHVLVSTNKSLSD
jgi:hypothetical protein